jgi:hypothetical protein
MNDIKSTLVELKKEGYCSYYPDKFKLYDLIYHLKILHNRACEYSNALMKIDNSLNWSLMSSCQSFLDIIINYFETKTKDDLEYEKNLSNICYFFHIKISEHFHIMTSKKYKKSVLMLIQTFLLLFWLLCGPNKDQIKKGLSRYDLIKMS